MKNLATILLAGLLRTKAGAPYPYDKDSQALPFISADGKPPMIVYIDDPVPDMVDQFDCEDYDFDWTKSTSTKEPGSGTPEDPYYATLVGGNQGINGWKQNCGTRFAFLDADDEWVYVRIASVEGVNADTIKLGPVACSEIGCDEAPEAFYQADIANNLDGRTFTNCGFNDWNNGSGDTPQDPVMVIIDGRNPEDCNRIYLYNGKYMAVYGYNVGDNGAHLMWLRENSCNALGCECGMNYVCPLGIAFTDLTWEVTTTTTTTTQPTESTETESTTESTETESTTESEGTTVTVTTLPTTEEAEDSAFSVSIAGIFAAGILF